MSEYESILSFVPQAIFFMVFIWIIFKLLFVWRSLLVDNEQKLKAERILLVLVMRIYCLLWFVLWATQRYLEMQIIDEKTDSSEQISHSQMVFLYTLNFLELFLELALYILLIRVICLFIQFLVLINEKNPNE